MVSPVRAYVATEYGQMHLRISSPKNQTALPMVCLHMSPQSGLAFEKFMTLASKDRKVIAPDYHGYGASSRPPETPPVTIQDYARTIWQALDQLGIEQVDLLGHHTGSKVAAEMAFQRPDGVNAMVFISTSTVPEDEMQSRDVDFAPVPLDKDGTRVKNFWSGITKFCGPDISLNYVEKFVFQALQAGDAYQWGNRAAFEYNRFFPNVLSRLSHKITVLNPNDDLHDITPGVKKFLQNGRVLDKKQWQHGFLDMNTAEAVEVVLGALDDQDEIEKVSKVAAN